MKYGRATCLPHKGGDVPLSAWPKDTTSKLAGLFSTLSLFAVYPFLRPQKAARTLLNIGRLFSSFALLLLCRFLIPLLLLMSGNAHLHPGPNFPCSLRAPVMQLGATSQYNSVPNLNGYTKDAPSSLSWKFNFHSGSYPPCCLSVSPGDPQFNNTLSSSPGLLQKVHLQFSQQSTQHIALPMHPPLSPHHRFKPPIHFQTSH